MGEETTVRASTVVSLSPDEAFALFTDEVDTWWKQGPRYRVARDGREGQLRFEPGVGGRLLETYAEGDAFELGRIEVWEPGMRLTFLMGGNDFAAEEWTTVDIRFDRTDRGTEVTLTHTGFDALGRDHGVWHGEGPEAFVGFMGLWWGDLLVGLHRASKAR